MKIEMSEELYEKITEELYEARAYRMNCDSCHMDDVFTETLSQLEQAYDEGLDTNTEEAYKRLAKGEAPSWSTGICEGLTAGYGVCNSSGYFEFPLVINGETNTIMSWEDYIGESGE